MRRISEFSYIIIFLKALTFSVIAILLSYFLFRSETSLISVFFTSLSLTWTCNILFERHKKETWGKITTPPKAHKKLAISLLCIFLGIMLGYGLFVIFSKTSVSNELLSRQLGIYREIKLSIKDIDFSNFNSTLKNNIGVLFIVFFIALFYRLGGVLLIVFWNASVWGAVFSYVIKTGLKSSHLNPITYVLFTLLCISPHLIIEATGYILCSMSGFFISKGITRYKFLSNQFLQILKSFISLFISSLALIVTASFIESNLTPKLISIFFK